MKAWIIMFLMIASATLEIFRIMLGIPQFTIMTEWTYRIAFGAIVLNYIAVFAGALAESRRKN